MKSFGNETISRGSHLEKLRLIRDGVGRDNISDFTTTLIKEHVLRFTQTFALEHVTPEQRRPFAVNKVRFNDETESWEREVNNYFARRLSKKPTEREIQACASPERLRSFQN